MLTSARDHPPVTPYLTVRDASAAIAFYRAALGATERRRMAGRDGRVLHAELLVNGGLVMLTDARPGEDAPGDGAAPVAIHVGLAAPGDVDVWFARATSNGATAEMAPTDGFWGERFAAFRDPFGHRWMLNAASR